MNLRQRSWRFLDVMALAAFSSVCLMAQQTTGILRGTVVDESGALVPAAQLTLTGPNGARRNVQSQADGSFSVPGLAPGTYTVRLALPGFAPIEQTVEISAGRTQRLNITLHVQAEKQQVTVKGEPGPEVSVEPDRNAGSLVLRGADLDALSDDPDDLAADLQALAGPAAGPNGGQIFIDGFSGGTLPPKENIREIRINSNPFSAEYDRLGYGRIEILTKPGTDKVHGSVFYNSGDAIFNARNPYLTSPKPDFISKMVEASITGPLTKKSSFTFSGERRSISDDAAVVGQVLDFGFNVVPFDQYVPTPNLRTSFGPRFDYALSPNNTLTGRYTYNNSNYQDMGVGGFNLATRGYTRDSTEHRMQLTETSILNSKVVNETRVQYLHTALREIANNSLPSINVSEAFNGGGAQVGHTSDLDKRWEIQNYTTATKQAHTFRFGVRVRTETERNTSPNNFGGTFTFAGGIAPILDTSNQPVVDPTICAGVGRLGSIPAGCEQITSIERYRRTQLFQSLGYSVAQMQPLGGGATLFTINGGNPRASVVQTDLGAFFQDDWRARPNLTVSLGLRYETQTNIHDWSDVAPRIGVAWAPGAHGGRSPKTVIRGGTGFFYSRFDNSYTMDALRFNGLTEQSYSIVNPLFLTVPPLLTLTAQPSTVRVVDSNLHAPVIWQSAIGIERQLPKNTTIASTFTFSHGTHMLRTRDINAPIFPGGPRPYASGGLNNEIFLYESSGLFNQRQWMVNVNTRASRKVSLFGFYVLNFAHSNTDGVGTLPANQYNMAGEYGRSAVDSRHHAFIGGNVVAPLGIRFSPFIIATSGRPFNITTGRDFYGDSVYTDRPSFAVAGQSGVVITPWGIFNPNPGPSDPRIPRNFAEAPGYLSINMRVSRTWGFGPVRANYRGSSSGDMRGGPGGDRGGDRGGRGGGDRGGRGGSGGPGGGGMRMGGGGMRGMFEGGGSTEHRFNLTLSANVRNVLNHVNPGMPSGNLSSPLFAVSTGLGGGFGPGGPGGFSAAFNRRMDLMLRLTF